MWLLEKSVGLEVARAMRMKVSATSEQLSRFQALHGGAAKDGTPKDGSSNEPGATVSDEGSILTVAGNVAEIAIKGVLVKQASFLLWLFGMEQTTYGEIISALARVDADPLIKSAVLRVDSPGGNVDGYFDALAAIQAFKKPLSVLADRACSGAYGIAALAGKITATSPASGFGSIGVAISILVDEDVVDLTSTEAPEKRPNVKTEEGKAVVVKQLDAVHDLFVDAIATGRGTTVANVNAEYGRGSTLLAVEAKRRGMIDKVQSQLRAVPRQAAASAEDAHPQPEVVANENEDAEAGPANTEIDMAMDLKTLRAQHPELCAELVREGEQRGTTLERDRAVAHLTLGEGSGDLKTAIAAVKDGSAMTQVLMAQYMTASMNRNDRNARQQESDAAGAAVDGAQGSTATPDVGDLVAARLLEKRGKTPKAVTNA